MQVSMYCTFWIDKLNHRINVKNRKIYIYIIYSVYMYEIYNFGRPFGPLWSSLLHTTFIWSIPRSREERFKRPSTLPFVIKIIFLGMGGSWNLQFPVSLHNRCFISNLVYNDPAVHEKMIKLDARRRPPTHSNSPIALERLRWPKIHSWSTKWQPRYYGCTWS